MTAYQRAVFPLAAHPKPWTDSCWCVERDGLPTLLDLSPLSIAELEPEWERLGIVPVSIEVGP